MNAQRAAICIALSGAILAAGCSPFSRFRDGKVETGSILPPLEQAEEERPPAAAPTLAAFEATEPASGLQCSGGYNPLEEGLTFTAPVVCEDGRTGKVTARRSGEGAGTLAFDGGVSVSVSLRRVQDETEIPPAAPNQLPAPDISAYVR